MMDKELLTDDEKLAVRLAADLYTHICRKVIGRNSSRGGDVAEICQAIHVIQNAVLSQAAARAYPDTYRLMGETLHQPNESSNQPNKKAK